MLLYNDVSMEIVSKLGHSSIKITQDSYGKIVQKKVSLEMDRLKGEVNDFPFIKNSNQKDCCWIIPLPVLSEVEV